MFIDEPTDVPAEETPGAEVPATDATPADTGASEGADSAAPSGE